MLKNISRRFVMRAVGALAVASLATACSTGQAPKTDSANTEKPAQQQSATTDKKPVVLTSFSILEDMASNVGGEYVEVHSIVPRGYEIHEFEPTPEQANAVAKADLILSNGLGLEHWLDKLTQRSKAPTVVVSEGVEPMPIEGDANHPNPHAWMSPDAAMVYVDNIKTQFVKLDPKHKDEYEKNAEDYKKKIATVKEGLMTKLGSLPEKHRALVSCEGAFSYLARDAKMTEYYIWPVNSDAEATPQQIKNTIENVKKDQVPAVFCESTVTDKPMQKVADATGARVGGVLYVDSLTPAGGDAPTFLDLLKHDAETIANGLTNNQ
ncbi:metal ABC transporter substrate-binding protein [Dermabacteraceae bacterium P13115]|nr:metal ABC transporter substrate-binding protein [Dermabacteraceae bacterium TAE3-ERU5]